MFLQLLQKRCPSSLSPFSRLTVLTPFPSLRISPIIQLGTVEDLWFRTFLCPFLTPVNLGVKQIVMSAKGCYDHFLKPSEALKSTLTPMASPPSTAIKEVFEKLTVYPPPDHELVCTPPTRNLQGLLKTG